MALTGLLLCGFLVAHLAGNLLLIKGAAYYDEYAHALHAKEELLMVAETGLFALFLAHLLIALKLTWSNWRARSTDYLVRKSKRDDTLGVVRPDSWMFWSGTVLLAFILLHLADFKLELRPDVDLTGLEPAAKATAILKTPLSFIGYLIGFLFLFLHLSHGVGSALQSLGINHPKYNKVFKWGGVLFAAAISLGFATVLIFTAGQPDSGSSTNSGTSATHSAPADPAPVAAKPAH